MHQLRNGFARQRELSFPTQKGTAAGNHNARMMSENACAVSQFRANPMTLQITGPSCIETHQNGTWCVSVSNCTNIQNIIWQGSSDGWNYTNIGSSTCVTLPLYNQYELYLRVTVTCAGGQTAFTDFMVVNCDGEIEPERPSIPDFTEIHPEIEVYPNPASSDITLFIKNVRDEPKDIFISNTFGVRTKINYNYDPISKSIFAQYNAELLSKGLHIITYYENNTIVSKKLMIHHE